jgi:two-component system sensor histidine kinase KdpD
LIADTTLKRPDPEELLRKVQAEEQNQGRGRLKIFLGYAAGVGKSVRMLDEGRRRRERGEDVVVGATQLHVAPEVAKRLERMEVIPLRVLAGVPTMDTERILKRRPQVCLIDGLAYDNPPGSPHLHRWQDAQQLLQAGISVITTVNLQYIEEYKQEVERIRGRRVAESVPQAFLNLADEIEVVDAPPDSCRGEESEAGAGDVARRQLELAQLREIALLVAADVVERQLEKYLEQHGLEQTWGTRERFLLWITPGADAQAMIASGQRNAQRFHGEWFVVYVLNRRTTAERQVALERNLALARQAGARIEALEGSNPVDAVLRFARSHGITQIFVPHTFRGSWRSRIFGDVVDELIRKADGIDVRVFPQ